MPASGPPSTWLPADGYQHIPSKTGTTILKERTDSLMPVPKALFQIQQNMPALMPRLPLPVREPTRRNTSTTPNLHHLPQKRPQVVPPAQHHWRCLPAHLSLTHHRVLTHFQPGPGQHSIKENYQATLQILEPSNHAYKTCPFVQFATSQLRDTKGTKRRDSALWRWCWPQKDWTTEFTPVMNILPQL